MPQLILRALFLILTLTTSGYAQFGAPGIGIGQTGSAPRRRLTRNSAPTLSPALNLVPGVSTSFEGQFLLRQIPQEEFNKTRAEFGRQIVGLQNRIQQNEVEIKTGIGKSGHSTRFLNYGSYYSFSAARGRRGGP
jgi:hypothetical protein